MKQSALIGTAALLLVACAGSVPPIVPLARQPQCMGPATPMLADTGRLIMAGVAAGTRAAIDSKIDKGEVAVAHLERRACNVEIEVLACTRPAVWAPERRLGWSYIHTASVEDLLNPSTQEAIAGAGTLYEQARAAQHRAVRFEENGGRFRFLEWDGPTPAPPLTSGELRGDDCARATHWLTRVDYATLTVQVGDTRDGPWSPTPLETTPMLSIAYHALMDDARPRTPGLPLKPPHSPDPQRQGCSSSPEEARQEDAAYRLGVALGELGRFDEAEAILRPIASASCHFRKTEAVYWIGIRDQRKTF